MFNLDNISYVRDSKGEKAVIVSLDKFNEMLDCIEEVEDIKSDEALFGDGLGLDSIDALELGIALQKKYGLKLKVYIFSLC